jgi:hypothetical protein
VLRANGSKASSDSSQFAQRARFGGPEPRLAPLLKNLGNGSPLARLYMSIQIDKIPIQPLRQLLSQAALAASHKSHKKYRAHCHGYGAKVHGFPSGLRICSCRFSLLARLIQRCLRRILPLKERSTTSEDA